MPVEQTRKNVIINEIHFWKQHNMLPEHYCDYLIALYTEGENEQEIQHKGKSKKYRFNSEFMFHLLFLFMMIITIVITNITDVSLGMQTLIFLCFICGLLFSLYYFKKKGKSRLLICITGAFLILHFSVQLNEFFFQGNTKSLYFVLLGNGFIWLVGGIWKKQLFFKISGLIAVFILFYLLLR